MQMNSHVSVGIPGNEEADEEAIQCARTKGKALAKEELPRWKAVKGSVSALGKARNNKKGTKGGRRSGSRHHQ